MPFTITILRKAIRNANVIVIYTRSGPKSVRSESFPHLHNYEILRKCTPPKKQQHRDRALFWQLQGGQIYLQDFLNVLNPPLCNKYS